MKVSEMVEVEVVDFPDNEKPGIKPIPNVSISSTPQPSQVGFVTPEQLDIKMNGLAGEIADKLQPKSALSPEVHGVVKAVEEVQGLRNALKDPVSVGIEQSITGLVTQTLDRAVGNMTGGQQAVAESVSLSTRLAQIAVNNLTGESSPLPGILAGISEIIGQERLQKGYDVGLQYVENQQNQGGTSQGNWPDTVLQLDENNQEHVVHYAQHEGYSTIERAQGALIIHKENLLAEIAEMQRIQQGGTQETQQQVVVQQPQAPEQQVVQQEVVEQEVVQQEVEQPNEILISQPGVKPMNEVSVVNDDKNEIDEDDIAEIAEELGE